MTRLTWVKEAPGLYRSLGGPAVRWTVRRYTDGAWIASRDGDDTVLDWSRSLAWAKRHVVEHLHAEVVSV